MSADTTTIGAISPEQRLRNLAGLVRDYTELHRFSNGRRRDSLEAPPDALYPAARQLARLVLDYLDGELSAEPFAAEVPSSCP